MTVSFYVPTHVVSGRGCVREAGQSLAAMGSRFLVVTGRHSARATGALDDACAALSGAGVSWTLFDGVRENPTIACVREGARAAREVGADAVLAIGGGSPMDAGKAMAVLAANPGATDEELFSGPWRGGVLPIACVPTTAGTGSEVTKAAIITDDAAQTKRAIADDRIFPWLALADGAYTRDLPPTTTVNTVIDALSHALEGFLSCRASAPSDALALDALSSIGPRLARLGREGALSERDRDVLMDASTEAGMVIANTGTTAVHGMGYSLTYFKHVPHGRANGLLLAAYLRWLAPRAPERVGAALGALGVDSLDALAGALAGLLGEPERLTGAEVEDFAARASMTGNIANGIVRPERADLVVIMRESFAL